MQYLTIIQQQTTIAIVEMPSLKVAKKYVESNKVASGQIGIYSTFNKDGIENTIKIIKK
ncbi:hypothetical protein [Flavobacterium sp.]|uniref:hypothetical protein n=1 Tax=Flavobacterium sp. TaxID=239 RepID=UPI0037504D8F